MTTRNHAIAVLLIAAAASASAVEATEDFKDQVLSASSRAEVLAELATARATGQLDQRGQTYGGFAASEIASTLTRAEVLADLQLWRESGMADASRGEAGYNIFTARYRQAQARYVALRASPRYAQLVQDIAQQRGEAVAALPPATRAQ